MDGQAPGLLHALPRQSRNRRPDHATERAPDGSGVRCDGDRDQSRPGEGASAGMKLDRRYVEKPWGRTQLPAIFDAPPGQRIGEIWFTGDGQQPLLVKYLFTSERLSIQVHPDDQQARARGLAQGKSECWYILDAEPGASLGPRL